MPPAATPTKESRGNDVTSAARALQAGDPLRALGLVGRLESAEGLLIRGIAYAQVGDYELAETSLDRAIAITSSPRAKDKDARTITARARAALVEILLNRGDAGPAARAARESVLELERLGDQHNANMQRLVLARAEVLLGRIEEARSVVAEMLGGKAALGADITAIALLADAEIAIRTMRASAARESLRRARHALEEAPNPILARALVVLEQELSHPIARLVRDGVARDADLYTIEAASTGELLLVDACRRLVLGGRVILPLARRPVLFELLIALARAWPSAVPRDELAKHAFDTKKPNASHRSRLRVEIGRLRKLMEGIGAEPNATADGYELSTQREVAVLLPPSDEDSARMLLLLGDGAAWSAQSLAEHTGMSKRTVQRAMARLLENGSVTRAGKGRDLRYARVGSPIASRMLLLGLAPKL